MLQLAEPSLERLQRSPLDLVVCQVRHDRDSSAEDAKKALRIRDALDGAYPVMEEVSATEVLVSGSAQGLQSVQQETRAGGWKLQSPDGEWTVQVTPDAYSLETNRYLDWDDFSDRLRQLTEAVAGHFDISVEKRLGLRYIDNLTQPSVDSPSGWTPWINPAILGPITHPGFGPAVETTQGIVRFDAGGGNTVVLRHGCVRLDTGAWSYVLDHDCFHEQAVEFSVDATMDRVEALHTLALQVFQAAITPEMFEYLKGEESR